MGASEAARRQGIGLADRPIHPSDSSVCVSCPLRIVRRFTKRNFPNCAETVYDTGTPRPTTFGFSQRPLDSPVHDADDCSLRFYDAFREKVYSAENEGVGGGLMHTFARGAL